MLDIEIVPCLTDNYSYIIYDKKSNLVGVIDPSEFEPIDNFISKKYKKLDFILNTHCHYDHVGGNEELKKKYKSKIAGPAIEKDKIPEIDILLNDNDIFNFGSISFKVFLVPGHTKGHIVFYSELEKVIFTGDTLFSLGCGKIFEGTYKQMFDSINKIKNLPKKTKIYCGHEYTKKNIDFCLKYENNNSDLKEKLKWINIQMQNGLPTIPVTLENELKTNIFLRCNNFALKNIIETNDASDELVFKKLRILKDEF